MIKNNYKIRLLFISVVYLVLYELVFDIMNGDILISYKSGGSIIDIIASCSILLIFMVLMICYFLRKTFKFFKDNFMIEQDDERLMLRIIMMQFIGIILIGLSNLITFYESSFIVNCIGLIIVCILIDRLSSVNETK